MSFDELLVEFQIIDAKFDRFDLDQVSDPSMLPTTGSAVYDGVLGANFPDGMGDTISVIGDMVMTANFRADTISGSVRSFEGADGVIYDGRLLIDNGDIDREVNVATTYTFVADIGGTLTDQLSQETTINGFLRGEFFGQQQDFVAGELVFDAITPDGPVSFDGDNTYFVGEKR